MSKEALAEQPKDYAEPIKVAVYGSLKQGFGNNRLLSETKSKLLGVGVTPAIYDMISLGGFPGLIDGDLPIHVEVYEVTEDTFLNRLDRLEGYPHFYNRELITVALDSGKEVNAWIYHLKNKSYDNYQRVVDRDETDRLTWKQSVYRNF